MSIDFYKKLNWAFGLIGLGVLFGVIFFSATLEIKDLDLWLHLKMGEFIVQHGYVPPYDVLSSSFFGKPWINHEWLFQVVLHGVREGWGLDGLINMQAGLVLLTFLMALVLVYDKDRQLLFIPILYAVLHIYWTRFTIRPDIFSIFFFIAYIFVLSTFLSRPWSVLVLFIMQVVWTNMHGYSLWGIVFVLIGLLAETIKRRLPLPFEWNQVGRLSDDEFKRLGLIAFAVIAATFFNPLGVEGALYPIKTLMGVSGDSSVFFKYISELQRPISWSSLLIIDDQGPYKALIMLSFISFFFNRRRIDISALMLWLVFLCFSLGAVRNMTYFAFAAFLVIGYNMAEVSYDDIVPFKFGDIRFFYMTGIAIAVLMTVQLVDFGNGLAGRGYYDFDAYTRKSEYYGVSLRNFSHQAAKFLIDNKIKGNFFNDFNSGAFLIGKVFPNIMVYMDGRTELRGGAFFRNYQKIWEDGDAKVFDDEVHRCRLTGVLINLANNANPDKLFKMLSEKPEWKPVYFDYDGIIFLKDIPANKAWIEKFQLDLSQWQPKEMDLQRLGSYRVIPYRHMRRARALNAMGFIDAAEKEALASLKVMPAYDEAFKLLADIARRKGNYQQAFEYYRLACTQDEANAQYRKDLAVAYLDLGNPAKAVEEAQRAVELDSRKTEGRYVLGRAYIKNNQYREGCDILGKIVKGEHESEEFRKRAAAILNEVASKEKK